MKTILISFILAIIVSGCSKNANLGNLPGGNKTIPGTITTASKLTFSSHDIFFPNTNLNDSKTLSVTLSNKGNKKSGTIGFVFTIPTSNPFSLTNDNCTGKNLAIDESCTVDVVFNPTIVSTNINILKAADSQSVAEIIVRGSGVSSNSNVSNTPPVVINNVLNLLEDTVGSGLLAGMDPNSLPITYEVSTQGLKGVVVITDSATGAYTYTPNANANGSDSFTFKVKNSSNTYSNLGTINVNITPVNDNPVANNQTISINEDNVSNGVVTASDVDGDSLTYTVVVQPTHGTLNLNSTTGAFTYTPNSNYNGTDSFTFKANDGTVDSNIATVSVIVNQVNDLPTANNQIITTNEDTGKSGTLTGSDVDGDSLTYSINSQGTKGTVTITNATTGDYTYTPNANANGSDSFTFKINDGKADSLLGTVTVNITPVNDSPVADNSSFSTNEDTVHNGVVIATDVDGDTLTYSVVSQSVKGTIVLNNTTGTFTYTPNTNANGSDSFTFKVNDGTVDSNIATVNITINATNDAPVSVNSSITTSEETVKNSSVTATDTDGDTLNYSVVTQPTNGVVVMNNDGTYSYTPNLNYNGSDSFTFKANDGIIDSNISTVSVTVTPVNDIPLADTFNKLTLKNTPVTITLTGSDVDGDSLTYSIVTQPTHGTLSGTAPNLTYTPNNNYFGTDSFTFKVNDGSVDSSVSTVSISITNTNTAPVASDSSITTLEDTVKNDTLTATDLDGDTLTYSLVTQGSKGTVTIINATTGDYTYTPNANANGTDSFTFKANDGALDSNISTITVNITPVNDTPVANNDSFSTNEDSNYSSTLVGSDIDGDTLTYSIVTQGIKGTVTVNSSTGVYTYTPNANANGTDSFTFKINDGTIDSNIATVSVNILSVNDAPVAVGDSVSTAEDTAVNVILIGSDVDGDSVTYTLVTNPTHGTLSGTAPNLTYTPDLNYNGNDSFTFKVNDGTIDSNVATVNISVTGTNDVPASSGQSITTNEDTAQTGTLVATDTDGDSLTYSLVTQGIKGTVTITNSSTGAFTYTPNANANGTDSFTFKANDGTIDSNISTVTVVINPVNDAPVSIDDSITTNEDTVKNGTLVATDVDGDALTYSIVSQGTKGTVTITNASTGSFTYTPNANANGTDSFTFKSNDGTVDSNIATVSVTITLMNDSPVSSNQSITTNEDSAQTGILVATDTDGDSLTYSVVAQGTKGTVTITNASTGAFTYTPNANANGSDSFTFKANDGTVDSNISMVSVIITPVNDEPVSVGDSFSTNEDTLYSGMMVASDVDGDALNYSIVSQGTKGTVIITNATTGAFTYTPNANANGSDSFTFKVNDGSLDSNVSTISVTINSVNDAPVSSGQSITTNEDTAKTGTLVATDAEGSALTYSIVAQGTKGTVTITNSSTGAFTYTPNANANGSDSFTFKANDGTADSNISTVSVTITPVNDAPVSANGTLNINEDTSGNFNAASITSDVDVDTLTYSIVAQGTKGTVTVNSSTGVYTYTPNANANGSDSFTFQASDGSLTTGVKTITVNITSLNDAPVATSGSSTVNEDTVLSSGVIASDTDGDTLTYSVVTQPTHGSVTMNSTNGTFSYTPTANYNGSDSFTYKVNDGTVDSNIATRSITVTPVNDAPVSIGDTVTTNEDTASSGMMVASDVDGDALTYSIVAQGTKGTVTITNTATGAYTYTPNANANGSDSFTFKANDGTVDSNVSTINVTITTINDAPVASNQSITTNEDTAKTGTLVATDAEGSALTYSIVAQGTKGTVTITNASTGAFTYTPNANANGSDSFTFKANDGTLNSNTATVSVTITPVNDAPVWTTSTAINLTTNMNTPVSTTINATDVDGDSVYYSLAGCSGGTCSLDSWTGAFTFTPNTGYTGTVGFAAYASDGSLYASPSSFITIQIVNPNQAPVATDQSVDLLVNAASKSITLAGTDADGNSLTYTVVTNPTEGTLSGTAPNLTYTPSAWTTCASENGTCTFTGTKLVKYGTASSYVVKELTGGTACDNTTFSDPSPGLGKTCWIKNTTDSFTFKANDGTVDSSNTATVTINLKEWYDTNWTLRRKVVFNLPISSDMLNFPVMIKLDSSRIDYSHTQNNGQDIRFVDSGGAVLPHEIEKWDETGTSIVWVKVSAGGSEKNNKYIWMYYGNASASDGQQRNLVWNNGYAAVYHLAETSGTVLDSTGNGNDGTVAGTLTRNTTGFIGNAYTNASNGACFTAAHNATHAIATEWTLESWAKRTSSNANRALIHKNIKNGSNWYWAYALADNSGYMLSTITDNSYFSTNYSTSAVQFANNEWMHMAISFKDSTNTITAYKNGVNVESNTSATRSGYTGSLWQGLNMMGDCNTQGFLGVMDEIRISNVARSDDWMNVQYLSQTDGLVMYSSEQTIANPKNYISYQLRIAANGDDGNNIVGLSSGQWNNSGWNGGGVNWVGEENAQDAWGYYRYQLPKDIPSSGVVLAKFKTRGQGDAAQIWNNASHYLKIVGQRTSNASQITSQTQRPGSGMTATTSNVLWNSGSLTWNWTGWNTSPDLTTVINEVASNYSLNSGNYIQLWLNRGGNLSCGAGSYCEVGMTDYSLNSHWGSCLLLEW